MKQVTSQDGTRIAFDRSGRGPALILIGGALSSRADAAQLASLLAPHLTVFAFDRRGRGDSGDTPPYAVEREIEDIQALVDEAGGSASLFGSSSGAVLALHAAARGLPIVRLAMYEPPFIVDNTRSPIPPNYRAELSALLSAGRRGDAVEYFMKDAVGVPQEMIAQMRGMPMWTDMEKMAPTLPYDAAIMGDTMDGHPLQAEQWASVKIPTLVMAGGASPEWAHNGVRAIAAALPNAEARTLAGQTHGADPAVLAPVLIEFFSR